MNLTEIVEESSIEKIKYGEFGLAQPGANGNLEPANGYVAKIPGPESNGVSQGQEHILKSHLEIFRGILQKRKKVNEAKISQEKSAIKPTPKSPRSPNSRSRNGSADPTPVKKLKYEEKIKGRDEIRKVIKQQLKMMDFKINYLENFEDIITHEKAQLEVYNKQLLAEKTRLSMRKSDTRKRSMALKKSSGHSLLSRQPSLDNRMGFSNNQNLPVRSNENSNNFVNIGAGGIISPMKITQSPTAKIGVTGSMDKTEAIERQERINSGNLDDGLEYSNTNLERASSLQHPMMSPKKPQGESAGKIVNLGEGLMDFKQASVSEEIGNRDQSLAQNFNSFDENEPKQQIKNNTDLQQQTSKNLLQEDQLLNRQTSAEHGANPENM